MCDNIIQFRYGLRVLTAHRRERYEAYNKEDTEGTIACLEQTRHGPEETNKLPVDDLSGIPMNNNRTTLTYMAGVLMAGRVFATAITFFIPIFLVRIFDQVEFGIYKQIFLIAMTLVPILGFSFGHNVFYFFPREPGREKTVAINMMFIYLVLGLLATAAFTLFPREISSVFKERQIAAYMPWIGIYIMLFLLSSFFENVTVEKRDINTTSVVYILSDFTRMVLLVGAAYFFRDLMYVLWAAIGYSLLRLAAFIIYIQLRLSGPSFRIDTQLIRDQIVYTVPYGIATVLYYLWLQTHNFVATFMFDARTFAIYSIGVFQLPLVNITRQSVGTILISEVSRLEAKGDLARIRQVFINSVRKLSILFFPLFVFLITIRREFIMFLFTGNYADSIPIFSINLVHIVLAVMISDPVFRAFPKHQYYKLYASLVGYIILVPTIYLFSKSAGIIGIVWGNLIVTILLQAVLFEKSMAILSFSPGDRKRILRIVMKVMVISVASSLPLFLMKAFVKGMNLMSLIAIEGLLYASVFIVLSLIWKLFNEDEKLKFLAYLKRFSFSRSGE